MATLKENEYSLPNYGSKCATLEAQLPTLPKFKEVYDFDYDCDYDHIICVSHGHVRVTILDDCFRL